MSVGEVVVMRAARATRGIEPLRTVSHDELQFKISYRANNTTSKIRLKLHILPFISLKLVSDLFNQLHRVIELHEYYNFD